MPGICVTALRIREKDQTAAKAAAGASWVQVELVFTTRAGTPFEPRNLNRRFETRCAKAGVRRITVHDMRHTCATLLEIGRIAFDASFGSSRERALPAAQRAALRCRQPAGRHGGCGDLGFHGPPVSDATMMRLMPLRGPHHRCGC